MVTFLEFPHLQIQVFGIYFGDPNKYRTLGPVGGETFGNVFRVFPQTYPSVRYLISSATILEFVGNPQADSINRGVGDRG